MSLDLAPTRDLPYHHAFSALVIPADLQFSATLCDTLNFHPETFKAVILENLGARFRYFSAHYVKIGRFKNTPEAVIMKARRLKGPNNNLSPINTALLDDNTTSAL